MLLPKDEPDDKNIVKRESFSDKGIIGYSNKATSYNSILLVEAIQKELDLVPDENNLETVRPENMVKHESKDNEKSSYKSPENIHLKRPHTRCDGKRSFTCYLCEKGFTSKAILINHENIHKGIRPYQCNICTDKFTTSGGVVTHMKYKHSIEKPIQCAKCTYMCVEKDKLDRHMLIHTGERPKQCTDCSYAATDNFALKRHQRSHTGEQPYKCEVCGKAFTQQNSLKEHRGKHNINQPSFKCTLCPATTLRKRDMKIHTRRLHNLEQPVLCKKCDLAFSDGYHLKEHMKNHVDKYFVCSICSRSCNSKRSMDNHALVHKDSKPFECDLYDNIFRSKELLKRHQNLHHNPGYQLPMKRPRVYGCSQCDKRFVRKYYLETHVTIHINETKSKCLNSKTQTKKIENSTSTNSSPKKRLQRC